MRPQAERITWVNSFRVGNKKEEDEAEKKKLEEIIFSINKRRAERIQKYLPRWYLVYQRFRLIFFLLMIVIVDFVLLILIQGKSRDSFGTVFLLFFLIYPVALIADRIIAYLAVRKVPLEVYYQDERHY